MKKTIVFVFVDLHVMGYFVWMGSRSYWFISDGLFNWWKLKMLSYIILDSPFSNFYSFLCHASVIQTQKLSW